MCKEVNKWLLSTWICTIILVIISLFFTSPVNNDGAFREESNVHTLNETEAVDLFRRYIFP